LATLSTLKVWDQSVEGTEGMCPINDDSFNGPLSVQNIIENIAKFYYIRSRSRSGSCPYFGQKLGYFLIR